MAEKLNVQQREAVEHKDGPILVIAGAGTGKTRVITERIAHILQNQWCANDEVLGLTFTEKAANEMEERLDRLMPLGYEAVPLSTFHSFCEKILRQYGIDIGLGPNFRIIEGVRHWQFLKERLFDFELDYYRPLGNPTAFIDALIGHFGRLKEEIISPADYLAFAKKKQKASKEKEEKAEAARALELAKAYGLYQKLLAENNYLDFADLHFKVIELFEKRPNILVHLQNHYKYVLVDEYQDTNIAQNRIVDFLVARHKNIMAVGDDDQSIYKFRGAAISNILQFEEKYPELKKVVLTENYRSSQAILDFAYASIQKNNPDRLEVKSKVNKKLTALRPGAQESIALVHFPTVEQEAGYIAQEIKKIKEPLNEIAILVRANAYARPVINALKSNNIPYQFLSERGLYNKEEVRDLIAVLRSVANPTDDVSLFRVLRMDYFKIPMEAIVTLMAEAKGDHKPLWSHVKTSEACAGLAKTLGGLIEFSKNHSAGETLFRFTESAHVYENLLKQGTIEAEEKIMNIATFFGKIQQFERESEEVTVVDFIHYLDIAEEAGENPSAKFEAAGGEGVQVSTVHGVKGLEFHTVFVSSLVNNRFPSMNRKDPIRLPDELVHEILTEKEFHEEEERRLFYVACTRAKEKLYLLHSDFYTLSASKNPRKSKRSRFVDEVIEGVTIQELEKTAGGVEKVLKREAAAG
ncbi:UvrD-helicase domain-containing protein, partial [Candidatus Peregrinibacteria bacterium]|nr:UvrD-helicase domain-containing protein [Candidatus Peregrinibacteria bacterium]